MRSLVLIAILTISPSTAVLADWRDDLNTAEARHRAAVADLDGTAARQRDTIESYQSQPFSVYDQYGREAFRGSYRYR